MPARKILLTTNALSSILALKPISCEYANRVIKREERNMKNSYRDIVSKTQMNSLLQIEVT
ncbi:MAG: hypothetical protein PHY48_10670 [Candidatus Cloacimonetes bacterium]|nr:hypothetical protein [Candidatus Cloacimonadota bacterium]